MFHPSCSRCAKKGISCVYSSNTSNPVALLMAGISREFDVGAVSGEETLNGGIDGESPLNIGNALDGSFPPNSETFISAGSASSASSVSGLASTSATSATSATSTAEDFIFNDPALSGSLGIDDIRLLPSPESYNGEERNRSLFKKRRIYYNSASGSYMVSPVSSLSPSETMSLMTTTAMRDLFGISPLRHFVHRRDFSVTPGTPAETLFFIERSKQYPSLFARYAYTPFIHSVQFEEVLPRNLATALAVCTLNEQLTDKNESAVLTAINTLSECLLSEPLPSDISQLLTLAQAITLTQCVRLFSGDIRTSSLAERAILKLINLVDELAEYIAHNTRDDLPWQRWILRESASRTLFVVCISLCAYCSLRGDYFYELVSDIPATISKHMWLARSLSEWKKVKLTKDPALCHPLSRKDPALQPKVVCAKLNKDDIDYEYFVFLAKYWGVRQAEAALGRSLREYTEFLDGAGLLSKPTQAVVIY